MKCNEINVFETFGNGIFGTSSDQRHPHFIGRLYRSKGKKFIGFSSLPNKRIIVWRKERGRRILC